MTEFSESLQKWAMASVSDFDRRRLSAHQASGKEFSLQQLLVTLIRIPVPPQCKILSVGQRTP